MTAFTSDLPRKSSRTSTHAVTVPRTASIRATMNAAPNVSLSAASASGLETTCQKACMPLCFDNQRRAAMGRTTMTPRYVEMTPTDRAVLPRPPTPTRREIVAADTAMLLMGRAPHSLLDLDHPAGHRIEPDLVHLEPAAEEVVADVEGRARLVLLAPAREVGPLQDLLRDRAVAVGREDALLLRRVRIRDERLRCG